MSTNINKKKMEQLGEPGGTAAHKLRKMIMFSLIQKCGLDTCYQCGQLIERVGDLSIEHIKPWFGSDDPVGLFYDLDNIAFSHLHCNVNASRRNKLVIPEGMSWCSDCKQYKPVAEFYKSSHPKYGLNGLTRQCKQCCHNRRISG